MSSKKRIVFFGTGSVAADSLKALNEEFEIESVVTKPTPDHHRGAAPVIELSKSAGLPVEFADSSTSLEKLLRDKKFSSRLGVIVDYGVIVSKKVIESFELGIVNSHFSLLPEWRGADPITFTVLSGQKTTGVSLMLIVEKLDEGPLLAQEEIPVPTDITTPLLTKDLIAKSNQMLVKYLPLYESGQLKPFPQPNRPTSYSRKLVKSDGLIDWDKPALQLEREVRAFAGWPKSRTKLRNLELIIIKASALDISGEPGKVEIVDKDLVVYCGKGALSLQRLTPAGSREMSATEFLAGRPDFGD